MTAWASHCDEKRSSLTEGSAGADPGFSQTGKCEIHVKGLLQIKHHNKGHIVSPPFFNIILHPSLSSFHCICPPVTDLFSQLLGSKWLQAL